MIQRRISTRSEIFEPIPLSLNMHDISFLTKMRLVLGNTLDFLFYPILTLISIRLFHMLLKEKGLIL